MAGTQRKKKKKMKTIYSLYYNSKENPFDRDLMVRVNSYCSLPENEGLPPTTVIRNYLLRKLAIEKKRSKKPN